MSCPALERCGEQFDGAGFIGLDGDASPIVPHEDSWAYKIVEWRVKISYDLTWVG
jgi:hypothetical protein